MKKTLYELFNMGQDGDEEAETDITILLVYIF